MEFKFLIKEKYLKLSHEYKQGRVGEVDPPQRLKNESTRQFLYRPLEAAFKGESLLIDLHLKMSNFTAEINN